MNTNVIYNVDCLDGMKDLPDESIDMILSDLPYGITKCAWDTRIPFDLLWDQYKRIIKPNGAIVLTSKQPFTTDLIDSNRKMFRYSLIWMKNVSTGFLNSKVMPLQSHEDICVFYKKKPIYNPQMVDGFPRKTSTADQKKKCRSSEVYNEALNYGNYDSTCRYPISVLFFPTDKHISTLHSTQKPVALFEYLIKTYTNENAVVLDSCAGSGTTGAACVNSNRQYILMEKDAKICNIAKQRLS